MLRFVLRDGLDATEQDVRETIEADEDIDRSGAIPHGKVMARARRERTDRASVILTGCRLISARQAKGKTSALRY